MPLLDEHEVWVSMLFGAPYSGKSTHRKHKHTALQESGHRCQVISIGETLEKRMAQAEEGNPFVQGMKNLKRKGELVPEAVPIYLFLEPILWSPEQYDVIITDGVGRRVSEMQRVLEVLYSLIPEEKLRIDVVYLNISWDEMVARFNAGREESRLDDTTENLKRRYQTFHQETLPAIEYARSVGHVRICEVVVDGKNQAEVHNEIAGRLNFVPTTIR